MEMTLTPVTPYLGLRVDGVALSAELDDATIEAFRSHLHTAGLLLFRDQALDEDSQVRLARRFGRISKLGQFFKAAPDAIYVSNTRPDGILGDAELTFHSDKLYMPFPPKLSMLYGLQIPANGGETLFSNCAYIVKTMKPGLRARLSKLRVVHEYRYADMYGGAKPVVTSNTPVQIDLSRVESADHPMIAKHPWSDNEYLTVNAGGASTIRGVPPEEREALMAELDALMDDPKLVYRHQWKKGDLVMWDNLLLKHARAPWPSSEQRTLRRCQIAHDNEVQ